jgi:BolA protein
MKPSADELAERLRTSFPGARIEVVDDSHLHAGHAGAEGGAGHYTVNITWRGFAGQRKIAQHRLVYDAVADWMPSRIHALSIHASEIS